MEQRTLGSTARRQRLIAFVAIALIAAATAVAFGRVFEGEVTTLELLAAAVGSAAVAASLERRNLLLATIVSGCLMLLVVGLFAFPESTWHGLPTLDTLKAMGSAAGQVGEQARIEVAPTPPFTPLLMAALIAVWAAVFSSHALAFRAGSPLLGLLPPVALVAFADTVLEDSIRPNYGVLFLVGALAVVFVDGLRRVQRWGPLWTWPGSNRGVSVTSTRGARRVAMAAVAIAVAAPFVLPGFTSKAIIDLNGAPDRGLVRVDPQVSIGAALTSSDPQEMFTVTSDAPSYWRMYALDNFNGTQWKADLSLSPEPVTSSTIIPDDAPADAQTITQTFAVTNDLVLPGVPMAYPPVSVSATGLTMSYDPDLQMVLLQGDVVGAGTTYTVTSKVLAPTRAELQSVQPTAFEDPTLGRYEAFPLTAEHMSDIKSLAEQWTAGAATPFDKVLAIQRHLTDTSVYHYDKNVQPRDDSFTLWDFLHKTRTGFCQQFASAMAILVRALGIPSRIAVGFTTGLPVEGTPDTYVVSTSDAHSWPEVYFPGYGWIAFEPTPGRTNPTAQEYLNPASVTSGTRPGNTETPGGGGTQTSPIPPYISRQVQGYSSPPPSRCRGHGCGVTATGGGAEGPQPFKIPAGVLVLIALAILALAALIVPPTRALRRRRTLRRAGPEARRRILTTYAVFADRADDIGFGRGPGETFDEYEARLAATEMLSNGELELLTGLARRAAYSPVDPAPEEARQARRAADATLHDLRSRTSLMTRIAGLYGLRR